MQAVMNVANLRQALSKIAHRAEYLSVEGVAEA